MASAYHFSRTLSTKLALEWGLNRMVDGLMEALEVFFALVFGNEF